MEFFLNLCWLSLLVPAYLLWRHRTASTGSDSLARSPAKSPATRPLVLHGALGCVLVLLFPVISATDDIHAMRAEMEEFSPGKRGICQAAGEKASAGGGWQNLPAIIANTASPGLTSEGWQELLTRPVSVPVAPSILHASRAPPGSRLA